MDESHDKPVDAGAGQVTVSPAASMIFSQVIATVAMELLEHLPGDKEGFLKSCMTEDLGLHHNRETGALCIFGLLDDIVRCRDKLAQVLDTSHTASTDTSYTAGTDTSHTAGTDTSHTAGTVYDKDNTDDWKQVEVEVNTPGDILRDSEVEEANVACETEHSKQDTIGEDDEMGHSDNLEVNIDTINVRKTESESVTSVVAATPGLPPASGSEAGGSKGVAATRRGRIIKRPLKLEEAEEDMGKLEEEGGEVEVAAPEVKRKRLVHPRRRQKVARAARSKPRDKISVDEVRRLVQEEKEKEARETGGTVVEAESREAESDRREELLNPGVLQNLFLSGLSELQVQEAQQDMVQCFSEMKASDEVKKMKKYYEEKMPFKYFCSTCSFKSKRESHFQAHMKLHIKNPFMDLHKCTECDFITIRQATLQRHVLTHVANVLRCSVCSYQTNSYKQLDMHKRKHMKVNLDFMPRLKCSKCKFTTLSKMKLTAHMDLHHNVKGEQVFGCNLCKYKSKRKEHLVRHKDNVHSDRRPFLCDLCGTAFKRVDALAAHKTTHVDKSLRKLPFQCSHCKKGFKSQAHLKEHLSVHTTVRSFQCHICGQMFKTRAVQRRHQQSIHFNPRSHKCTHCNKDFNTKYAFQRHLRIHDGDPAGHLPTEVQPQVRGGGEKPEEGEEAVDENISAIKTITIAPENLNEFTQQLQTVSDQLQSDTDVGEIYIQGIDNMETGGTINIINMQGQEVEQIYIPGDTSDLATTSISADQIKQIFVTAKSDGDTGDQSLDKKTVSVTQSELIKQILMSSDAGGYNIAGMKEFFIQSEQGTEPVRHILIPSVDNATGVEFEGVESFGTETEECVGDQTLIVQSGESDATEGEETVKVEIGGTTYQIRLENGQTLLNTGSTAVQNL